jgi:type II secretory pathway pseudopilin PulG
MAKAPSNHRGGQAGFTLVEALIAIIVLVFGLIGVTNLFVVAKTTTSLANQSSAATTAASETLERLRAMTFFPDLVNQAGGSLIGTGCDAPDPADPTGTHWRCDTIPGVGRIFTQWQITQVNGNADLYLITVRSEGSGIARRRSRAEFTLLRSCTGPQVVGGCP